MNVIEIIQLLLISVLCVIVCVTDIHKGLITNKTLLPFFALGIILSVFEFTIFFKALWIEYLKNVSFIIAVSIVLYASHIWAGGDCKLTILIALLFPARLYLNYNNSRFNLWLILIITFCAGFIYTIVDSTVRFIKTRFRLDYIFNAKKILIMFHRYIKNLLLLVAVGLTFNVVFSNFIKINNIVYFLICVIIVYFANKFKVLNIKVLIAALALFDALMIVFTRYIPFRKAWYYYLLLLGIMLIKVFAENYNYETICVDELKKGYILSRYDTLLFQNSKVTGLPPLSDETLKSRLTESEVESVKTWSKTKQGKNEITIVRKMPFAIFITVGVICYIILGGLLN